MDSVACRIHPNAGLVPPSEKGFWCTNVNTVWHENQKTVRFQLLRTKKRIRDTRWQRISLIWDSQEDFKRQIQEFLHKRKFSWAWNCNMFFFFSPKVFSFIGNLFQVLAKCAEEFLALLWIHWLLFKNLEENLYTN